MDEQQYPEKEEPDKRDWEEIVHLLEIVDRDSLKKMSKAQLIQVVLDLLAITSQVSVHSDEALVLFPWSSVLID